MSHLQNKTHHGSLFVISAPAGTGKTTLVDMLTQEFPDIVASISYTTRKARQGELSGVHYNFITKDEFERRIELNEFIEHVTLYNEYYGTSAAWIEGLIKQGRDVILVIDTQGAKKLQAQQKTFCRVVFIFLLPPSLEELKRRLIGRGTESAEKILQRLSIAEEEIRQVRFYDYCIVNDQLQHSYAALKSIYIAEKHRVAEDSFWN